MVSSGIHSLLFLFCDPQIIVTFSLVVAGCGLQTHSSKVPRKVAGGRKSPEPGSSHAQTHATPFVRDGTPSRFFPYISLARNGSHAHPFTNHYKGNRVAMTCVERSGTIGIWPELGLCQQERRQNACIHSFHKHLSCAF